MPIDIDKYYEGIKNAETGSEENPYIRTKSQPKNDISTAYGPVQITGKLAEGSNKAGYLKNSKDFYEKEMKPRYDRMKKADENDKDYHYGGSAELDPAKHGQDYETMAKDIMTGIAKESGNDENKFVEKWRGKSERQDPKYYQKVREGNKKFEDEHKSAGNVIADTLEYK